MVENSELIALKSVERDTIKIIKKLEKKLKNVEPFKIIIEGEEYTNLNEVDDMFGCEIISKAQRDSAYKKYNEWLQLTNDLVVKTQIRIYSEFLLNIQHLIIDIKMKEGK